ncbi:MAG: outer membrane lipoprotein carrier protein LolA [Actinomycetota bacterium]
MLALVRRRKGTAALAALVVATASITTVLATRSTAAPNLPPISATRLVSEAIAAVERNGPVHGDASVHIDLGLPSLPSSGYGPQTGPLSVLAELAGDHSLRVWKSPDGVRIADLLPAAERAVFATAGDLWLWNSTQMTAVHVLPPAGGTGPTDGPAPRLDPSSLAARALDAITPTTAVSVGTARMVAGRPAYALVLEPRTDETLVGQVEVDVDADTFTPLRLAVTPRGGTTPALESTYTSVSFDPIDPSVFEFTPAPGVHVKEIRLPGEHSHQGEAAMGWTGAPPTVRTFGEGWTSTVAIRLPTESAPHAGRQQLRDIEQLLPYSGPLLSVRMAERAGSTWILAGMVPQSALERVEQRLP